MSTYADSSEPPRLSRLMAVAVLAWIAMLGVDFLLHAGLLARLYAEPAHSSCLHRAPLPSSPSATFPSSSWLS